MGDAYTVWTGEETSGGAMAEENESGALGGACHCGAVTWSFDTIPDAATAAGSDTYDDANGTVTAGVRSFTPPGGNTQYTYIRCRKVGETIIRGELNKNFYDNRNANGIP